MAGQSIRIELEQGSDAIRPKNHPSDLVRQIEANIVSIDMTKDANSYKKMVKGEIIKIQSRIFFDYLIRLNYTNQ